jgi:glycosyltransferase involved in cell wall biosynthesis
VALFTDSFDEANGVATLSREFAAFARRRKRPFFCVHSGPQTAAASQNELTTFTLKRGFASFRLDHDLFCDPFLTRYRDLVLSSIQNFQPDLVQITGPGDMGILGAWIAHLLRVPLVASWHTNLHEYAGRRLEKTLSFLPATWRKKFAARVEEQSLRACMWFYRYGKFTLAPNETMVRLLESRTGHPSFLMAHGVDIHLFSPLRRSRKSDEFRIGFVGRLTPEKNVRLLAELEQALVAAGRRDFRIVMIGEGSEREWLRKHLVHGELPGVLRGPALADAFANMDAFVFPSRTDTFGLVLLEAMASGVPVVVGVETGKRVGIAHGVTGFHTTNLNGFTQAVIRLMDDRTLRQDMGRAARTFSCSMAWDAVFEQVYQIYEVGLETIGRLPRRLTEVPVAL